MNDIQQEMPSGFIQTRIGKLQAELAAAGLGGMLLTQNIDLYYFTGSMQNGYGFVPAQGDPVFYVKRSFLRAGWESPIRVKELGSFRQFRRTLESDFPAVFAVEELQIAADLDVMPAQLYMRLADLLADNAGGSSRTIVTLKDGSSIIRKLRMSKSDWEIARIEAAAAVVDEALTAALNELREGITELEWMARIEYELRVRGHIGLMRMRGYNQEIATGMLLSGPEAAIPSYFDGPAGGLGLGAAFPQSVSRKPIRRNEPILIDVGCCIDGYVIDQTRTAVIGKLTEELADAYAASEAILRDAEKRMTAGSPCSSLYERSLEMAKEFGLHEHFMGFGADQAKFLGHGIGLEVDEWPVLAKGFDLPLAEGMVIAVEPKFTFPGKGVVGIENSYLITNESPRPLTRTKEGLIIIGT
ncbi:M24 family metallopeptidase [Paenibacillus sp. NPDC058071]|uniref:M24 family metallopeptidase n=1 Tax=Paenibacillus sp. NPDC058071 TaxID=3346326 RepID=UPI0036DC9803